MNAHKAVGPASTLLGLVSLVGLLGLSGVMACGTRSVQTPVVDTPTLQVSLRLEKKNGVLVNREFQHPSSISQQRLSHILGALEIETREEGEPRRRLAAIHPELLVPISRGMVEAFEQADSTQEVVVIAIRKQQRLGIFHKKFLTTLIAFFRDERLVIHLSRVEWEIPREREKKNMPEPWRDEKQMEFRSAPGRKMAQAGSQGVSIRWRDNLFSSPVRTAGDAGGPRRERIILMDSPIPREELDEDGDSSSLDGLDPETLRALADLEEARRNGSITETEYRQRRETLTGEAPY
jgi:hypothetical protein